MLSEKKIGIVAHFYMDPEVQGVLTSAAARWPHIHISDSLVMADRAVKMVEQGCTTVAVLGVDFMSENVAAILKEAGHSDVQVSCNSVMAGSVQCCACGRLSFVVGRLYHYIHSEPETHCLCLVMRCKNRW